MSIKLQWSKWGLITSGQKHTRRNLRKGRKLRDGSSGQTKTQPVLLAAFPEQGKKGRQDGYQGQTCPASPSIFVLRKTQLHASSVPFNSGVLLTGKCNPVMVPGSVNESEQVSYSFFLAGLKGSEEEAGRSWQAWLGKMGRRMRGSLFYIIFHDPRKCYLSNVLKSLTVYPKLTKNFSYILHVANHFKIIWSICVIPPPKSQASWRQSLGAIYPQISWHPVLRHSVKSSSLSRWISIKSGKNPRPQKGKIVYERGKIL